VKRLGVNLSLNTSGLRLKVHSQMDFRQLRVSCAVPFAGCYWSQQITFDIICEKYTTHANCRKIHTKFSPRKLKGKHCLDKLMSIGELL
jgi:hypothetical protein